MGLPPFRGKLISSDAIFSPSRPREEPQVHGSFDGDSLYGMISSVAILSPSSPKKNRRFTGLPGKLPVSLLVTMIFPSFCSHAKGSLVYWHLVEASAFHCLIADRPR